MNTALAEYYNLKTHPRIQFINYESEDQWLEERRKGIGGSDAAAVLGISKYTSPLKLYKIKIGEVSEDLSDNVFIKKGKDLEALIRNKYVIPYFENLNYRVCHPEHMFVDSAMHWLRANCDGLAIPKDDSATFADNIIVEIKWVSEWGESNWFGEDYCGVPAEYYTQVQHYMLVTGARKAVICALFDKDWEMHYFEIPFDAAFAARLHDTTKQFYEMHMLMGMPPKIDPTLDREAVLEKLGTISSEDIVKLDDAFEDKVAEYISYKEECDKASKQVATLLKEIEQMYLNGYRSAKFKVQMSKCSRKGFGTSRFAEDYPELYRQYLSETEYTRTVVRRK